jgi:hypothetical protein
VTKTLLKESVDKQKYTLPVEWKLLKEKKWEEEIDKWLIELHNTELIIKQNNVFHDFISVVKDDLILFRKFITSSNDNTISYRDLWCYLIHHLMDDMEENLQVLNHISRPQYVAALKDTIQSYINSITIICGDMQKMSSAVVEFAHAKANEDEAQDIFKVQGNDEQKKLWLQDKNRSLGRFAAGVGKQFGMKTVAEAKGDERAFDNEFAGENFDAEVEVDH